RAGGGQSVPRSRPGRGRRRRGELDDGDYIAKEVGTVKMTTCASPAYLDQHGTPETMDELQQHQAVNWINSSNRQVMP
ncbi:hypothetical protein QP671_29120, partial [Klebsiella pneumoniae]|nr:hypothetical protein [Klebsiella pneumoniae]